MFELSDPNNLFVCFNDHYIFLIFRNKVTPGWLLVTPGCLVTCRTWVEGGYKSHLGGKGGGGGCNSQLDVYMSHLGGCKSQPQIFLAQCCALLIFLCVSQTHYYENNFLLHHTQTGLDVDRWNPRSYAET